MKDIGAPQQVTNRLTPVTYSSTKTKPDPVTVGIELGMVLGACDSEGISLGACDTDGEALGDDETDGNGEVLGDDETDGAALGGALGDELKIDSSIFRCQFSCISLLSRPPAKFGFLLL
jgi:hypothetical protein